MAQPSISSGASIGRDGWPIVVIVGAGFGGLRVARRLARANVHVVVVDRKNHHLFQPLLYQVATGVLTTSDIAFPIRRVLRKQRNAFVFNDEVTDVDLATRTIGLGDGPRAPYDWLVLAAGATSSYFGNPTWEAFAPGMKTLGEATLIRSRILRAFEDAEAESDPVARQAHLTFVVVGGGATGVELAGAIKELAVDALAEDYRRFDAARARVMLVEAGPRLLPDLSETSSAVAKASLERIGVEVRLGKPVREVMDGAVTVGEERIVADTVVWAAGVRASALGESLGVPRERGGRVRVNADCSVPGHPEVFVIGDMAAQTCARTGRSVPGVAPGAIQMADMVAKVIRDETRARARGQVPPARPAFRYFDKGSMATIGRGQAVAEIGPVRLRGLPAWLAWLFVHLVLLVGVRNRLFVLLSWGVSYLTFSKGTRIIAGDPRSNLRRPLGTDAGGRPLSREESVADLLGRRAFND
jgi:NADH:ubiquinone reductase (H+-translocating)